MTPKTDIYSRITDRIVAQLEAGVRPWQKPWNAEHAAGRITRPLRSNGEPYRGINVLVLWDAAEQAGYSCPIWLTFKQAIDFGGNVKKGEKSTSVVYASTFNKVDDEGNVDKIPFLKQYAVFNAEQCEGLPEKFSESSQPVNSPVERIERADLFFRHCGSTYDHGGNRAFYRIDDDVIRLPRIETFVNAEAYYATLAHEHIHWTRHEKRLNREFGRKRFGDCGYAMEELVAELGSAFLCADLELTPEIRDEHAEYLACWIQVLKDDKKAIFTAASYAGNAVEFLHGFQPQPTKPESVELVEA